MIWVSLGQWYWIFARFSKGWLGWRSTNLEPRTSILEALNINFAALGCPGSSTGSQWLPWLAVYGTHICNISTVFQGLAGLARSLGTLSVEGKRLGSGPTSNEVTSCQVTSNIVTTWLVRLSRHCAQDLVGLVGKRDCKSLFAAWWPRGGRRIYNPENGFLCFGALGFFNKISGPRRAWKMILRLGATFWPSLDPNGATWTPFRSIVITFGYLICVHVSQCQPEPLKKNDGMLIWWYEVMISWYDMMIWYLYTNQMLVY